MEKFAARRARAPDHDLRAAFGFGFVDFAQQRGENVRVLQIEVIAGAVEIRRHQRNRVESILRAVGLAELDAGDFGDGVRLVGGLKRAGEEMLLFHGLRRVLGIDAGGAEEQELFDAVAPGRIDDVEFDGEIVAEEIGRIGGVGQNAADFGGREEDVFGALGCKEMVDGGAIGEVGLAACSSL